MARTKALAMMAAAASLAAAAAAAANPVTFVGTIRDFNADGQDFESQITGLRTGLVSNTLGPNGVPVLNTGPGGWTPGAGGIASVESFSRWYSNDHPSNATMGYSIALTERPDGTSVYRNDAFFPIDNALLGNEGRPHNYHFTYHGQLDFQYQPGQFITAGGDDDVWVFINGQLALDVGGVHSLRSGTVALDTLNLTPGETYRIDLFFAERHTTRSELWFETNIRNFAVIPLPSAGAMAFGGIALLASRRRRKMEEAGV